MGRHVGPSLALLQESRAFEIDHRTEIGATGLAVDRLLSVDGDEAKAERGGEQPPGEQTWR